MQIAQLETLVADLLAEARRQGATSAEAAVHQEQGLSVTARLGEIETIEQATEQSLGVTVYQGHCKGSASTQDFSAQAIQDTITAACQIASYTAADPAAGLADAACIATQVPDLDLHHPWELDAAQAGELACTCEAAALDYDAKVTNSEGASVQTGAHLFVYGNTHGFIGGYPSTRHSLSCTVLTQAGDEMQRDYWYDMARIPGKLADVTSIGQRAAQRSLARLGSRRLPSLQCPVLFRPDMATGLLRSLCGAIQGHALYRQASFLLDALDQPIFPDWVRITENPLLRHGLASAPFDHEGVATQQRELVSDGVLRGYILDSYSGRKLNRPTTGNAGGVRNLCISNTGQDFATLIRQMDRGLIVTELMGQGTNPVTGDYSQGAAGFWVEGGEIQYPVSEITIAGNLRQMYQQLQAVGTDNDYPGSTDTGSWLVDGLSIAGC
ncbi:MAG: metalloprotease PmbA [Pseudomonadota bacterium]